MTQEEWKFINTFAPWFSAIGTILAVILSLYFSYSARKISLIINVSLFDLFQENTKETEEYILIQITNTSYRDIIIKNFFWEFGFFKKHYIMIGFNTIDKDKSTSLPAKLKEGEMATFAIKIINDNDNYLEKFYQDFLKDSPSINIYTLKIIVCPSIGKCFKQKIDNTLQTEFIKIRNSERSQSH